MMRCERLNFQFWCIKHQIFFSNFFCLWYIKNNLNIWIIFFVQSNNTFASNFLISYVNEKDLNRFCFEDFRNWTFFFWNRRNYDVDHVIFRNFWFFSFHFIIIVIHEILLFLLNFKLWWMYHAKLAIQIICKWYFKILTINQFSFSTSMKKIHFQSKRTENFKIYQIFVRFFQFFCNILFAFEIIDNNHRNTFIQNNTLNDLIDDVNFDDLIENMNINYNVEIFNNRETNIHYVFQNDNDNVNKQISKRKFETTKKFANEIENEIFFIVCIFLHTKQINICHNQISTMTFYKIFNSLFFVIFCKN